MNKISAVVTAAVTVIIAVIGNYLFLPAWNIHDIYTWIFVGITLVIASATAVICDCAAYDDDSESVMFCVSILALTFIVVQIIIAFCGSKMVNALKYAKLIEVAESDWSADMLASESIDNIALMDTATADVVGERSLSSLADVASRFDIGDYTQVNIDGKAKKVAPLEYAGFMKWAKHHDEGIVGYDVVDPISYEADVVRTEKPIMYAKSEYFARDLRRHIRKAYKNAILGESFFEIDAEGNPVYVTAVYKTTIGLFGGRIVDGVIITDACTGENTLLAVNDIPEWVDVVYTGDYISDLYNKYGMLQGGFWNSLFSQTGCRKATDDFGYITIDNDIWMYTGVTSAVSDSSNIGFIMANERTGECRYYDIGGADEASAMAAAEGEVSAFEYKASFPSLVNINGEPTYVLVLKDANAIVKDYALVNLKNCNKVAVAETQEEVFALYANKMGFDRLAAEAEEKIASSNEEDIETTDISIVVEDVRFIIADGNTVIYILGSDGVTYHCDFREDYAFLTKGTQLDVAVTAAGEII